MRSRCDSPQGYQTTPACSRFGQRPEGADQIQALGGRAETVLAPAHRAMPHGGRNDLAGFRP
jgi:hypothetical protein